MGAVLSRLPRGCGGMADALGSGPSDRKVVEVQVLSSAPIGFFLSLAAKRYN